MGLSEPGAAAPVWFLHRRSKRRWTGPRRRTPAGREARGSRSRPSLLTTDPDRPRGGSTEPAPPSLQQAASAPGAALAECPGPRGTAGAIGGESAGRPALSTAKDAAASHPVLSCHPQNLPSRLSCLSQIPGAPEVPWLAVGGRGPARTLGCGHAQPLPSGGGVPPRAPGIYRGNFVPSKRDFVSNSQQLRKRHDRFPAGNEASPCVRKRTHRPAAPV